MALKLYNLDWLMVYCREPNFHDLDADYFQRQGYFVKSRDYGSPQYHEMFTIYDDHNFPMIEIRRSPKSLRGSGGIFERGDCHIRLTNRACYMQRPIDYLREFLLRFGYTFMSVSRVDVCCDFVSFDNGLLPADFSRRYVEGAFLKINQARVCAHGVDDWDSRFWNSISWGSPSSVVRTKMYDKSLELIQVKNKPWIREQWFRAGLLAPNDLNTHVWRVEFSLNSSAKTFKKGGDFIDVDLSTYDCREKLRLVFHSLCERYFHFKEFRVNVRKYRCPDVVLFQSPLNDELLDLSTRINCECARTFPLPASFLSKCAQIMNDSQYSQRVRDLCKQLWDLGFDSFYLENAVQ